MSLKYTIFWTVMCDAVDCRQETATLLLDAKRSTDEAESGGWVTPDGLRWYCPSHVNSEETSQISQP